MRGCARSRRGLRVAGERKTTIGRLLSGHLSIPFIDKDQILEALFESLGSPDPAERFRLSRASDEVLFTLAESSVNAVLVNWWNHDTEPSRLRAISTSLVEVFCDCPVELAAARFGPASATPAITTPTIPPKSSSKESNGYARPSADP